MYEKTRKKEEGLEKDQKVDKGFVKPRALRPGSKGPDARATDYQAMLASGSQTI